MKKQSRRKLEKKRKAKRDRRPAKRESLAYRGNKYRTKELVRVIFRTEVGIHETDVMTDRKMTDHTVRSALEKLILQVQTRTLPALEDTTHADYVRGEEEDLVIWNICRNWQLLLQTEPHPGRDKLIGVLRTILGSIEVWGSINPASRGYLRYIEGFVKKLGVSVDECSPEDLDTARRIR